MVWVSIGFLEVFFLSNHFFLTKTIVSNLSGWKMQRSISAFTFPLQVDYWVDHVSNAVRFTAGMEAMEAAKCPEVFLEIGPRGQWVPGSEEIL